MAKPKEDEITFRPEIEKLGERWRKNPKSLVFVPLADAYRKGGMLEEAIEVCNEGLKYHPNNAGAHVVLAKCYYDTNKPALARNEYEEAINLDPQNIVAIMGLANIYREREMNELAAEHYRRVLDIDPSNDEAERILAKLEPKIKKIQPPPKPEPKKEAKPKKSDGKSSFRANALATTYEQQGFPDKALKIYESIAEERGINPDLALKINDLRAQVGMPPLKGNEYRSDKSEESSPPPKEKTDDLNLDGLESLSVDMGDDSSNEEDDIGSFTVEDTSESRILDELPELEDLEDLEELDESEMTIEEDTLEELDDVVIDEGDLEELSEASIDDDNLDDFVAEDIDDLENLEEADLTLSDDEALEIEDANLDDIDEDVLAVSPSEIDAVSGLKETTEDTSSSNEYDFGNIFIDRAAETQDKEEEKVDLSSLQDLEEEVITEEDVAIEEVEIGEPEIVEEIGVSFEEEELTTAPEETSTFEEPEVAMDEDVDEPETLIAEMDLGFDEQPVVETVRDEQEIPTPQEREMTGGSARELVRLAVLTIPQEQLKKITGLQFLQILQETYQDEFSVEQWLQMASEAIQTSEEPIISQPKEDDSFRETTIPIPEEEEDDALLDFLDEPAPSSSTDEDEIDLTQPNEAELDFIDESQPTPTSDDDSLFDLDLAEQFTSTEETTSSPAEDTSLFDFDPTDIAPPNEEETSQDINFNVDNVPQEQGEQPVTPIPPGEKKKSKKDDKIYSDHGSFQDWLNNLQKK